MSSLAGALQIGIAKVELIGSSSSVLEVEVKLVAIHSLSTGNSCLMFLGRTQTVVTKYTYVEIASDRR